MASGFLPFDILNEAQALPPPKPQIFYSDKAETAIGPLNDSFNHALSFENNDFPPSFKPGHSQFDEHGQRAGNNYSRSFPQPVEYGSNISEDYATLEIECPPQKVGHVIGSKGIIIKEIHKRTGCIIQLNQDVPSGSPRLIRLSGSIENVRYLNRQKFYWPPGNILFIFKNMLLHRSIMRNS